MARPKSNLTPEEKKERNRLAALKYRSNKTIKPSVVDAATEAQLKADIQKFCAPGRSMLVAVRSQICGSCLEDWTVEYSAHNPKHADRFTLKELVVDEVQHAARLKAKAYEFYDQNIKPHLNTLPKALKDYLDSGIAASKVFQKDKSGKSDYEHMNQQLTTIIDSLPIKESDIEDLKNVCRTAYRHSSVKSWRDFEIPPIPYNKLVRGIDPVSRDIQDENIKFAQQFDKVAVPPDPDAPKIKRPVATNKEWMNLIQAEAMAEVANEQAAELRKPKPKKTWIHTLIANYTTTSPK